MVNHACSRGQGARVADDVDVSVKVRHAVRFREADALRAHIGIPSRGFVVRERAHAEVHLIDASPDWACACALVELRRYRDGKDRKKTGEAHEHG